MNIRKANRDDLPFLTAVRNDPVSAQYSKRGVLSEKIIAQDYLENPAKQCLIASLEGSSVAYAIFERLSPTKAEISLALHPDFRGKGLAKTILNKASQYAVQKLGYRTIEARIFTQNSASMHLFQKCNYHIVEDTIEPITLECKPLVPAIGLIFDFDGVIVDSLSALYEIYLSFLASYGIKGSREEFDKLNGPSLKEIVRYFRKHYSLQDSIDVLHAKYLTLLEDIYEKVTLNPGVIETLQTLKELGITCIMATSSKRAPVEKLLERYDIRDYFVHLITGDDVTHAKPDPEIYIKAEALLGDLLPIVVEDSQNGLDAANSAELITIHYGKKRNSNANYHCNEIRKIIPIVVAICNNYLSKAMHKEVSILCDSETLIPEDRVEAIEQIWKRESQDRPLFNGSILHLKKIISSQKQIKLHCSIVQYKQFLTHLRAPHLSMEICPLAVSGIIIDTEGNTLLAKRKDVTEYPNHWELAPAGSIDAVAPGEKVSYENQIYRELFEETGLHEKMVSTITPFALLFDRIDEVYDIALSITLLKPLRELFTSPENGEYDSYKIVSLHEAMTILFSEPSTPTSKTVLANYLYEQ